MDVATTLSFFDKWVAHNKTTCGVSRVDVTIDRDAIGGSSHVKLRCPMCLHSISGTFRDEDMPQVVALLGANVWN